MIDLAKEIWQTMCTNKLRTALTGFSVAWGIFMLILLLAISNGIIGSFDENSMKADPFRIQIWPGLTSKPYAGSSLSCARFSVDTSSISSIWSEPRTSRRFLRYQVKSAASCASSLPCITSSSTVSITR